MLFTYVFLRELMHSYFLF